MKSNQGKKLLGKINKLHPEVITNSNELSDISRASPDNKKSNVNNVNKLSEETNNFSFEDTNSHFKQQENDINILDNTNK